MDRLLKKLETAKQFVPPPVIEDTGPRGIIAYGTTHWAIVESRDQLAQEHDWKRITCGCGRIRFRARSKSSWRGTTGFTWWSRIATSNCSIC